MHELAITQSVVEMVVERTAGRQISLVRLEVGRLCGVMPEAMEFCYELVIEGTPLEGSMLVISNESNRKLKSVKLGAQLPISRLWFALSGAVVVLSLFGLSRRAWLEPHGG